jgi:hypothetical protein
MRSFFFDACYIKVSLHNHTLYQQNCMQKMKLFLQILIATYKYPNVYTILSKHD